MKLEDFTEDQQRAILRAVEDARACGHAIGLDEVLRALEPAPAPILPIDPSVLKDGPRVLPPAPRFGPPIRGRRRRERR